MEETINFWEALERSFGQIHKGDKIEGIVVAVNKEEAIVDIGTKHTGFLSQKDLCIEPNIYPEDVVSVGDTITCIVKNVNNADGIVTLCSERVYAEKKKIQKSKNSLDRNLEISRILEEAKIDIGKKIENELKKNRESLLKELPRIVEEEMNKYQNSISELFEKQEQLIRQLEMRFEQLTNLVYIYEKENKDNYTLNTTNDYDDLY